MKRIKYFVVLACIFFINVTIVRAADFTTYVTGNSDIYAGESTTVTFGVKNSSEIYGLSTSLTYDSSKLEITSSSGLNGFTLTLGGNAVLDSASGKSGSFTLFSITFKAKSSFVSGESTTVTFGNVESGDGEHLYKGSSSSIKINMLAPKSSNNNFSYLKVDGKDVDLKKSSYSITVENNIESISIEGDKEDPKASISGTGTKKLALYSNVFNVVVTAENGSKRTYTITVIRKDEEGRTSKPVEEASSMKQEDPTLDEIIIDGVELDFNPLVFNYKIKVDSDTEKLDVIANSSNSDYIVNIDNPEELVVGENIITITVTDKNGNVSKYKIMVFKPEKEVVDTECNNKKCNHIVYIIIIIIEFIIIAALGYYILKRRVKKEEIIEIKE